MEATKERQQRLATSLRLFKDNTFEPSATVRLGIYQRPFGLKHRLLHNFNITEADEEKKIEEETLKFTIEHYDLILNALTANNQIIIIKSESYGFRLDRKHLIQLFIYGVLE